MLLMGKSVQRSVLLYYCGRTLTESLLRYFPALLKSHHIQFVLFERVAFISLYLVLSSELCCQQLSGMQITLKKNAPNPVIPTKAIN